MDYITLIGNVGFPIAIALFVLVRLEGTIKENTKAINQLKESLLMKPAKRIY